MSYIFETLVLYTVHHILLTSLKIVYTYMREREIEGMDTYMCVCVLHMHLQHLQLYTQTLTA